MQAFVPKSRRPKFELTLKIIDLNNVPLVNGTSFVKWHLPHSNTADHRGRTEKRPIKDHKVTYDFEAKFPVRLVIERDQTLQELYIHFEVLQEYGRGEKITLGNVKLNLAEYIEPSEQEEGDDGVVRRYLMQDSKINSTIKIGIHMRQIEGDRNWIAPPLRTAAVFGGIAGVLSTEAPDSDSSAPPHTLISTTPSLSRQNREAGELQDMYRRTLAAYWAAQPGELKADDAIEDIFAGGDGWGDERSGRSPRLLGGHHGPHHGRQASQSTSRGPMGRGTPPIGAHTSDESDGAEAERRRRGLEFEHGMLGGHHRRNGSGGSAFGMSPGRKTASRDGAKGAVGRASLEMQAAKMTAGAEGNNKGGRSKFEVTEFDVRDDLRSWRLGG